MIVNACICNYFIEKHPCYNRIIAPCRSYCYLFPFTISQSPFGSTPLLAGRNGRELSSHGEYLRYLCSKIGSRTPAVHCIVYIPEVLWYISYLKTQMCFLIETVLLNKAHILSSSRLQLTCWIVACKNKQKLHSALSVPIIKAFKTIKQYILILTMRSREESGKTMQ